MLFVLALLAGCTPGSFPTPRPLGSPPAWVAPVPCVAPPAEPEDAYWKRLSDDWLDGAIETAWSESGDVQVLIARLEQAHAAVDAAQAERRPQLDFRLSAAREREPRSLLPDAEGSPVAIPANTRSRLGAQIGGRYEVDLLGRLALRQRAAQAGVSAGEDDLRALRQWLAAEIVVTYGELRLVEHHSAVAASGAALLEELHRAELARFRAGIAARDALRRTEARRADNRDEQSELAARRHALLARLAVLLGRMPTKDSLPPDAEWLARRKISGAILPDTPASVIVRRADVSAAWRRVEAAAAGTRLVQLERYPTLTLTGAGGFVSEAFRHWFTGDAFGWLAQAALQSPLLDGGRHRARSREAEAAFREAHARYRKVVLEALAEVETALSDLHAEHERVELAEGQFARMLADHTDADAMRAAGVHSRPAVLQTRLAQLQAEAALQQRRCALLVAGVRTERALGR
jgi:multidrug efflux system outer membrane protein